MGIWLLLLQAAIGEELCVGPVNGEEVYTEDGRMKWQGKRSKSFVSGVDV